MTVGEAESRHRWSMCPLDSSIHTLKDDDRSLASKLHVTSNKRHSNECSRISVSVRHHFGRKLLHYWGLRVETWPNLATVMTPPNALRKQPTMCRRRMNVSFCVLHFWSPRVQAVLRSFRVGQRSLGLSNTYRSDETLRDTRQIRIISLSSNSVVILLFLFQKNPQ